MDSSKDTLQSGYLYPKLDPPYSSPPLQNGVAAGSPYATPQKKGDYSTASTHATSSIASKQHQQMQLKRIDSTVDSSGFGTFLQWGDVYSSSQKQIEWVIQIGAIDYKLYKGRLIKLEEAEFIHNKLSDEQNRGYVFVCGQGGEKFF